jgi:hypothetical protein
MDVQRSSEVACRQSREHADDPEDEALRPRDTEARVHAPRRPIETMIHGPHQAHELKDWSERAVLSGFWVLTVQPHLY